MSNPRTYIARVRVYRAYFDQERDEGNLCNIRDSNVAWEIGADGTGMSGMEAELLSWEVEDHRDKT